MLCRSSFNLPAGRLGLQGVIIVVLVQGNSTPSIWFWTHRQPLILLWQERDGTALGEIRDLQEYSARSPSHHTRILANHF